MNNAIVYEHPLNERIRTFLRLEYLFSHLGSALGGSSIWESRVAISTLIEIMGVFGRTELKSDLLKELEKQSSTLKRLENAPNVNGELVKNLVTELDSLVDRVYSMDGQIGSSLRQSELLKSIMQRSSIPGGTCDFDLPAYHFWLQQPPDQRHAHLRSWSGTLDPVRDSIIMVLRLLRESAAPQDEHASGGMMQKTLDSNVSFQLLRVFVPGEIPCYTEVSGSKHRFSIRFMEFLPNERARQTDRDVHFKLSCCVL